MIIAAEHDGTSLLCQTVLVRVSQSWYESYHQIHHLPTSNGYLQKINNKINHLYS